MKVVLSVDQANFILKELSKLPYESVFKSIQLIQSCVQKNKQDENTSKEGSANKKEDEVKS